jgi:hypothetical protein
VKEILRGERQTPAGLRTFVWKIVKVTKTIPHQLLQVSLPHEKSNYSEAIPHAICMHSKSITSTITAVAALLDTCFSEKKNNWAAVVIWPF